MENRGAFVEHLEELRRRLWICLGTVAAASAAGTAWSGRALEILTGPMRARGEGIYYFAPQDAFVVQVKTAFFLGLLVSSPVLFAQAWLFVSPALTAREKRFVAPLIGATTALFLGGAAFAFRWVLPWSLDFLLGFGGEALRPQISILSYLTFATSLMLAFGVAANLPVMMAGLAALGLVSSRAFARQRRAAAVAIFVAAAVLTPPDVFSQVALAVPLLALYEGGILAARILERKRLEARAPA